MSGPQDRSGAVQVIGHRGAAGLVSENTLASFDYAVSLGVDAVECDVHLTRDGQVVVMHDEEVNRTTNGTGRVMDLDQSQLCSLDAGDGQSVPLLDDLLDLLAGRCRLLCELKADGMEDLAAAAVTSHGLQEDVMFISFRLDHLLRVRQCDHRLRIGALIAAPTLRDIRSALDLGVSYIGIHDHYANGAMLQRIRQAGVSAGVWTPNTLERMQAMIGLGATHITTDRPDILLQYLGRTNGAFQRSL